MLNKKAKAKSDIYFFTKKKYKNFPIVMRRTAKLIKSLLNTKEITQNWVGTFHGASRMSTSNAPERDNINQDEVTKFWGCEMTHLAPQEKELVVMLWQKLKQRRQNTT